MRKRYKGARRNIGCLIPVLVSLCVLAAGALYFINDNMTYTREGTVFSASKEDENTEENVNANLIIENEEKTAEIPEEVKKPELEKAVPRRAAFVPLKTVTDTAEFEKELKALAGEDINTVVLEVKSDEGFLAFVEDSPVALAAGVSAESDEPLNHAAKKARESGYDVAFFISCFKDNEAARKNQPLAARTENRIIWLDGNNTRWLNPYSEKARGYITDIISTAALFRPEEIILSNISFPAEGKTEIIYYGENPLGKSEQLDAFIEEARKAVPTDIALSAVYENYTGASRDSAGQKADSFIGKFRHIFISDSGGKTRAALSDDLKARLAESGQKYCAIIDWGAEDRSTRIKAAGGAYMLRRAENKVLPPPVK